MVTSDDGVVCLPVERFGLEVWVDPTVEDADCCTLCWCVVVVVVEASRVEPLGVQVVRFERAVDDLDGCDVMDWCLVALVVIGGASRRLVDVEER